MDLFQSFALVAFAAFAIPLKTRIPALLFFFMYLIENTYHDKLDGLYYYLFVATQDTLLTITFINMGFKKLYELTIISLVVSFYGWVIYELYLPPLSYNICAQMVMLFQIIALGKDNGYKALFGNFKRFILVCGAFFNNQKCAFKKKI